MADSKFQTKLNAFLESEVVHENDFLTYITMLMDLSKSLARENGFHVYNNVVKNWITGFEVIFSERKTKQDSATFWETYMSKFCSKITITYFALLQTYHQFEPNFTQMLYGCWKTIVSRMNGLKRAESFITNIDKFKLVIQHLRTAEHRCEQIAIFSLLRLYVGCVPIGELRKLKENDNVQIVNKIVQLMKNPTILNQHRFFHDINALGHYIESVKPKKIICRNLKIDCDNSEHEMWLDFNKKNRSVNFLTVSLTGCYANQIWGMGVRIVLRENFYDDRMLEMHGIWTILAHSGKPIEKCVTITVFLLNEIESSISKSVKNIFRFVNPRGSSSEGFNTHYTDKESAKDAIEVPTENLQQPDVSFPSVLPPKLVPLQRYSTFSLPVQPISCQKPMKLNLSLQGFAADENNDKTNAATVAEQPTDANIMYVIMQSVQPVVATNDVVMAEQCSTDGNLTYVLRETVNPISSKQSENDDNLQEDNYDEINMDIDGSLMENESRASGATFTIEYDGLPDMSIEENGLADDDDISSGLSFRDDTSVGEDEKYGDSENDIMRDMGDTESVWYSNDGGRWQCTGGKQIEILEDITIVPPTTPIEYLQSSNDGGRLQCTGGKQIEILEDITIVPPTTPIEYLQSKGTVNCLQFSQEDERTVLNRKKTFNVFSQPTTLLERFNIKDSPSEWQNVRNVQLHEPIPPSTLQPIEISSVVNDSEKTETVDESNESMQNNRKRSMASVESNTSQKSCTHCDRTELSTGKLPIGPSSQNAYESFRPLATSTRESSELSTPTQQPRRTTQPHQTIHLSQSKIRTRSQSTSASSPSVAKSSLSKFMGRTSSHLQIESIIPPTSNNAEIPKNLKKNEPQKRTESDADRNTIRSQSNFKKAKIERNLEAYGSSLVVKEESQKMSTSSSSNSSHKQSASSVPQTESVIIIDPPADTEYSQKPLNLSLKPELRVESTCVSQNGMNLSKEQASLLVPYRAEIGTIILPLADTECSQRPLNLSLKPELLIESTCVPQNGLNLPQEQASSLVPQRTGSGTIIDPPADTEHTQMTLNLSQTPDSQVQNEMNSSQSRVSSSVHQRTESVTIIDLPESNEYSQKPSNLSLKSESQIQLDSVSQNDMNSLQKPKMLPETLPVATQVTEQKCSLKSDQSPSQQTRQNTPENQAERMAATQTPKEESNGSTRYSSLKRTKVASTRRFSKTLKTANSSGDNVEDIDLLEVAENSSDGQTSNHETVAADTIHIDNSGSICDNEGCLFADNSELQRAAKFYIENDGLQYMKSDSFKVLAAENQKNYERKLRAIHEMINHGLEGVHKDDEKSDSHDPYRLTSAETTVERKKPKFSSQSKKMSVTITKRRTTIDYSNKITFARKTNKVTYVIDDTSDADLQSLVQKYKTISKNKNKINEKKNLPNVTTPQSTVNLTSEKIESRQEKIDKTMPSNQSDGSSSLVRPRKLPIYASNKMREKHQHAEVSSTVQMKSTGEMKIPIYASDNMKAANQKEMISRSMETQPERLLMNTEAPSTTTDYLAPMEDPPVTDNLTDNQSENIKENCVSICNSRPCEMERDLCSSMTCNKNLIDLIGLLNEILKKSDLTCGESCEHKQVLMEFIDRLHLGNHSELNPTISDCAHLFNGFLASLEQVCDEASRQFIAFHEQSNEQAK